jgi:Zn-dependent protease with chaperone function
MTGHLNSLPSRKWSIVALSSAAMALVFVSYILAIALAFACLAMPIFMFGFLPIGSQLNFLLYRLLFSAFGVVAGGTILWSLVPTNEKFDVKGVSIDLRTQPRLAQEIQTIAEALREPMPSEVYLIGDANAFVSEVSSSTGFGRRRILAMGLPLLQMLTIAQFRAVLAHEFAHYYAGDTRLGPWLYEARVSMSRLYMNLGKNSQAMRYLRRWRILAAAYLLLMKSLQIYWKIFMRITQAISRRQEMRSDELACYIAGSQNLSEGLQGIRKCNAGLGAYWNSFVLPVAIGGYQPDLANGFQQFMQAPQIAKATSEILAKQESITEHSPFDSHPPLNMRLQQARRLARPAPQSSMSEDACNRPMISLIENLPALEASLVKKVVPAVAAADLKPLNWETAGADIYIPGWRKKIASCLPFLAEKNMVDLPLLLLDPRPVAMHIYIETEGRLNESQRIARAYDILFCAFALCLLQNGWNLITQPGNLTLKNGTSTIDPATVLGDLRSKKLSAEGWQTFRANTGIGDWPLAAPAAQ